jgi:hypothetical protein
MELLCSGEHPSLCIAKVSWLAEPNALERLVYSPALAIELDFKSRLDRIKAKAKFRQLIPVEPEVGHSCLRERKANLVAGEVVEVGQYENRGSSH